MLSSSSIANGDGLLFERFLATLLLATACMKSLVLIPSYNTGPILRNTVAAVLEQWKDVLVVIDGSDDGSDEGLEELGKTDSSYLQILRLPQNEGKGAAVLAGITWAQEKGFTHALTLDSDGQHPVEDIPHYLAMAEKHPEALILGKPVFDNSAPNIRVQGRKISNWWTNHETLGWGIGDSLFGMRLYPIEPLREVFASTSGARRFDFEPEVAVRFCWRGVPVLNIDTPVRYLTAEDGGVSQFRYLRDNVLLTGMHLRLFLGFLVRFPYLLVQRTKSGNPLKNTSAPPAN
jgi:glycosyltransferase involved in cell wall biosynthesis